MADYISREAAEILMCDACGFACKHYKRVSGQSLITADDCYHLHNITNIPAADVAEVRHGHWTHERLESTAGGVYPVTRCSICGDAIPAVNALSYCPNCGAKMDERSEEDNG